MSENVGNEVEIGAKINQISKTLEDEFNELKSLIGTNTDISKDDSRNLIESLEKMATEVLTQMKLKFESSINKNKSETSEKLQGLRESLDGQLESLRTYATKLFDDEEERLVNTLEASLTNVEGITKDHSGKLDELIKLIDELASKSANAPVELIIQNNESVKSDMQNLLAMQNEHLTGALIGIQNEFREKIADQIEKVFMGVTVTKGSLDGIIKDTLSRLEENLNLLHAGIDDNFTKEIGVTQDLIHSYEGKLLKAIENTKLDYNELMINILNINEEKLTKNLDEAKSSLQDQKKQLSSQVSDLTADQRNLVEQALKELEEQIIKSKAQVIDSHGVLKDDLEKLLHSNSQSVKEMIESSQKESQDALTLLKKDISAMTDKNKSEIESQVKISKKAIVERLDKLKSDSQAAIETSTKGLKGLKNLVKDV